MRIVARMGVSGPSLQAQTLLSGLDQDRFDQRLYCGSLGEGEKEHLVLRALSLPSGSPVVAFIGRVTIIKRPDRFLKVARLVRDGELRRRMGAARARAEALFGVDRFVADVGELYESLVAERVPRSRFTTSR